MRVAVLLITCLVLQACSSTILDPTYRAADLVFDEGLLGRWAIQAGDEDHKGNEAGFIEFTERRREVNKDGSVDTILQDVPQPGSQDDADHHATAIQTRSRPMSRIYGVEFSPSGDQEASLSFNGYLNEIKGDRYIGLQIAYSGAVGSAAPYPFMLPTHTFWRLERRGDTLTILRARRILLMVSGVPYRATTAEAEIRAAEEAPDQFIVMFTSLDTLREYYRRHAADASFFDPGTVYQRIR